MYTSTYGVLLAFSSTGVCVLKYILGTIVEAVSNCLLQVGFAVLVKLGVADSVKQIVLHWIFMFFVVIFGIVPYLECLLAAAS